MGNLDVNGYNETFKAFADFAKIMTTGKGDENSIARLDTGVNIAEGALAGRTITASTTDSVRGFFKWFRSADDQKANNATREIFWNSIIDMFGGESKIPESVKDAMKLADYDKGKPLTARRILAVKAAIDADGTAKTRYTAPETFNSPGVKTAALGLGFTNGELPKLARVAHLYAQATGLSEMDAMKAVAEPNSKPNRLMQYGGRFLDNAENFKNGLRLMDSFKDWFTGICATRKADGNKFTNARTLTELNFNSDFATRDTSAAFERFVFEELAVNDAHDLSETDPEKLFGVKDNAAMRFFATDRCYNFVGVVANVPPERRGTIYAVLDKLSLPLAQTKDEAHSHEGLSRTERSVHNPHIVIGRILRHLPEIERLASKGALTEKNIVKTLFPDLPTSNWTRAAVNEFTHYVDWAARDILMAEDEDMDEAQATSAGGKIQLIMEETCCTLQEGIATYKNGARVSPPQYMTTATFALEKLDGTTSAARDSLDGNKMGDLWRPYNYGTASDPENKDKFFIKDAADMAFGFTFPDGTSLKANAVQHAGNIPTIVDKLESLAGKVHPRQQSALMFAVSQSGLGVLKGGLEPYGITASEHAAVNFSLSKNAETGTITVKYESPEALPFKFSWTATVDVDGNVKTTPLKFVDQEKVAAIKTAAGLALSKVSLKNANDPNAAKLGSYIETIMNATDGDPTLLDFFQDQDLLESLLFSVTNDLRSLDDVSRKVDGLKANIEELRTATKGDDAMFSVGVKRLKTFRGKALPNGVLTALVNAAAKADISKLRNIHTASTPAQFHNAFMQYHEGMCRIVEDSKVFKTYKNEMGGDEILNVQLLSGSLLAARCGNADALRAMKAALHSDHAAKANSVYGMIMDGNFNLDNTPEYVTMSVQNIGKQLNMRLNELDQNLSDILGDEPESVSEYQGEKDGFMPDVLAILSNVRDVTLTLHSQLVEETRKGMME